MLQTCKMIVSPILMHSQPLVRFGAIRPTVLTFNNTFTSFLLKIYLQNQGIFSEKYINFQKSTSTVFRPEITSNKFTVYVQL